MSPLAIAAFLLVQNVISIKPGFVHFADGKSNVQKFEQLKPGSRVQTEADGRVEIGLGPDSLLRVDENSAVVMRLLDSADVSILLESGTALVEVETLDKPNRIRVETGDLNTLITSSGTFRFSSNTVSVLDGKIGIEGTSTIVQKGWEVAGEGGNYRQTKLAFSTPQVFKAFLNSPKAGFVNAISGDSANVKLQDTVRSDQPVQTGPATYVELLLRPGAFLRIDENSSVVLESTTASDVVVRVVSGDALLENVVPEERLQIRVNVGGIKTVVASHGLYRFTSDTASVIDGVIRFGKDGEAVFNGMQVRITDKTYDTTDLKEDSLRDGLDLWSAERARTLARANFISDFADSQPNFFLFLSNRPLNAAWIYSPSAKGITFIPQLKRESYYGDSFVPSSALMPSTSMVGTINVRVPQQQPNLPAVTPAKETPVQPPAKTSK